MRVQYGPRLVRLLSSMAGRRAQEVARVELFTGNVLCRAQEEEEEEVVAGNIFEPDGGVDMEALFGRRRRPSSGAAEAAEPAHWLGVVFRRPPDTAARGLCVVGWTPSGKRVYLEERDPAAAGAPPLPTAPRKTALLGTLKIPCSGGGRPWLICRGQVFYASTGTTTTAPS